MTKIFPASLDRLYEMLEFIRLQSTSAGFQGDMLGKIELAVEEALVNIISYGYPVSRGSIEIRCVNYSDKGIKITLLDRGIPYNPLTNSKSFDPRSSLEVRTLGGYGIFFILKLMDEVDYHREDNSNILTLTKYQDF